MSERAVFLDKDGTLVVDVPYNVDPGLIRLIPRAAEGLVALHAAGYRLIVVSNQSGVARGYFSEDELIRVEWKTRSLLEALGVSLAGFYYCPHHPEGIVAPYARDCDCRKPEPGLISRAAREHGVDLRRSWLVGDLPGDVEAGSRAGCRTILLGSPPSDRPPYAYAADLAEAARIILAADQGDDPGMRR